MENDISKTYKLLAKDKNIPAKHIYGEEISKAQYYRFINGESEITVNKLLYLLEKINVSLEEFFIIEREKNDPLKSSMKDILYAFQNNQAQQLMNFSDDFYKHFQETQIDYEQHLAIISENLAYRLEGKGISKDLNIIKKYLLNVDVWTHYELVLFNNSFFLFDYPTIHLLFDHSVHTSDRFRSFSKFSEEKLSLYSNLIIFSIEHGKTDLSIRVINEIEQISLQHNDIYGKTLVYFWNNLRYALKNKKKTVPDEIRTTIYFLDQINAKKLASLLKNIVSFIFSDDQL